MVQDMQFLKVFNGLSCCGNEHTEETSLFQESKNRRNQRHIYQELCSELKWETTRKQ